ncbi:histidine phosphatase family protein [Streptomyces sp. ADI95-17]|uniref:histidine phosphatase family protein n=1 Tax=Streptomyces sp. ADI95-17 TaxID=1522759 RepID=UPI001F14C76E|nr:histidine phosphatase family protein [Streptomyces sp. ADI95-17]
MCLPPNTGNVPVSAARRASAGADALFRRPDHERQGEDAHPARLRDPRQHHRQRGRNRHSLATGSPLTGQGRRQAWELGDRRRNDGIAAVFTSDLHRAVDTARVAFASTRADPPGSPPA